MQKSSFFALDIFFVQHFEPDIFPRSITSLGWCLLGWIKLQFILIPTLAQRALIWSCSFIKHGFRIFLMRLGGWFDLLCTESGMFHGLEYGLNFSVFRSKVTSRKLTTFSLASMVIFRLHCLNILQIFSLSCPFSLGSVGGPLACLCISVKADFNNRYFIQLGKQVTTD